MLAPPIHRIPQLPLLLLLALTACQAPRPAEQLVLDWLDGSVVVHEQLDDGLLPAEALVRAWNSGVGGAPDEQGILWGVSERVRLEFEILANVPRRLVVQARAPEDTRLPTEILLDGERLTEHAWGDLQRLELDLPQELARGIHVVEIVTPALADEVGIGIRAAGFERQQPPATLPGGQWRWSPLVEGSILELSARCTEPSRLELLLDAGELGWTTLWSGEYAAGESFSETVSLGEFASLGMARLALLTEGPGLQWTRLRQIVPPVAGLERRNLVLLSLDTTRWDALGAYRALDDGAADYGMAESPSPNLDELAKRATLWSMALAPAPVTAPTHASFFLSSPPRMHGLDGNGRPLPRARQNNFACYLEAWGYRNAGFISLGVLLGDLGFGQGFAHYSDELGSRWNRPASKVQESLAEWLADEEIRAGQPRFVWLHYSDPHMPYGPPNVGGVHVRWDDGEPERMYGTGRARRLVFLGEPGEHRIRFEALPDAPRGREYKLLRFRLSDPSIEWSFGGGFRSGENVLFFRSGAEIIVQLPSDGPPGIRLEVGVEDALSDLEQRGRYALDVKALDDAVGESMEWMRSRGWLDDALVCVFADHGEDIGGDDGRWGHVEHVRPSLSRVPMFLLDPRERPRVDRTPAGIVDLAPTLCARLGIPQLSAWTGANLFEDSAHRALHLESLPPEARENWRALVRDPYKLEGRVAEDGSLVGELHLYDLRSDPLCTTDLLRPGVQQQPTAEIRDALVEEWTRWVSALEASGADAQRIDPRMEERLRALGYLD